MNRKMIRIEDFLEILNYEGTPKEIKDSIKYYQDLGIYVMCEDVGSYFGDDDESYDIDEKKTYRQINEKRILDNSKSSSKNEKPLKVFSVITSDGYVIGTIETKNYSKNGVISESKIIQAILNEISNRELFEFVLDGFYQNKTYINKNASEEEKIKTKSKISDKVLSYHDQFLNSDDLEYYDRLGLYVYRYPFPVFVEDEFKEFVKKEIYEYTIFDEEAHIIGQFCTSNDGYFSFPSERYVREIIRKNLKNGDNAQRKDIIKNFLSNEKLYSDLCLGVIGEDEYYRLLGE